jgi:hypothetical protein
MWGLYTHFIQPANWAVIGDTIKQTGYNFVGIHGVSPWAAKDAYWPWLYDAGTAKFDLSKKNPVYREHVRECLTELLGKRKIGIELALFDFYYTDGYIKKGSSKHHPFRNNKQGINWSDNTDSLGASLPWFTHVAWKTKGLNIEERVDTYSIKYKWLWDYIRLWAEELKKVKDQWPNAPTLLIRFANEAFTRYNVSGELQKKEGGEDKLYQIVMKEFKKAGLEHAKDFNIVDDHMIFVGSDFWGESGKVNGTHITGWAPGGRFDRQPDLKWLREVHVTTPSEYKYVQMLAEKYPSTAGLNFTIVSNDSWKPENSTYIPELSKIFHDNSRFVDIKVPSEPEVINAPIDSPNIMIKVERVAPVMERIAN